MRIEFALYRPVSGWNYLTCVGDTEQSLMRSCDRLSLPLPAALHELMRSLARALADGRRPFRLLEPPRLYGGS